MITLTPFFRSFGVAFTPSSELDVVIYRIHAVPVTEVVNGDFTPSANNMINEGPETSFFYTLPAGNEAGMWFVKVVAIDTFGDDALNYSAIQSVNIPTFQLLPDEMYQAGRADFNVRDSIFNFGVYVNGSRTEAATLYWTAGSITRGAATFTLAAGSIGAAHNSYIRATLNSANGTASLEKIAFSSSYPSIDNNQIIIAVTSKDINGAGNYICYVRQANSMELEGAIIRDLTVTSGKIKELDAGKIKSGELNLYWDNGAVKAVKNNYADTTAGIFLGIDGIVGQGGVPKMNIGDNKSYMKWTGDTLEIAGKVTMTEGSTISTAMKAELKGESGLSYGVSFKRANDQPGIPTGGTFLSPVASDWSSGVPADNGTALWMTTRLFTVNGAAPQQDAWSTPAKVGTPSTSARVQFSIDGVNGWHDTPEGNDAYMRSGTSTNNGITWTYAGAVRIKGSSGANGADAILPSYFKAPSGTGFFMSFSSSTSPGNLGYYENGAWKSYMDSKGNLYGNTITGSTITGSTITGGTFQTATSGARITINENGQNVLRVYNAAGNQTCYLGGTTSSVLSLDGTASGSFSDGVIFATTRSASNAIRGEARGTNSSYVAKFQNFYTGMGSFGLKGEINSGIAGSVAVVGVAPPGARCFQAGGGGTAGPFTGSHDGLILKEESVSLGDILVDMEVISTIGISNTLASQTASFSAKQPTVIGVLSSRGSLSDDCPPVALSPNQDEELPENYEYFKKKYDVIHINSLGEGQINVCKDGGNIEAGDYICSSNRPGKGMKQDDDLLHNYTVAKARESVVWADTEDDIRMIACTYHCG